MSTQTTESSSQTLQKYSLLVQAHLVAALVRAPEAHHHALHQQLAVLRQLGVEHRHEGSVDVREPEKEVQASSVAQHVRKHTD